MKLTDETKLFLGLIAATVAMVVGAVWWFSKPAPTFARAELLLPTTSIRGNPDAVVYLVEFSDFQCPACKTAKPYVDSVVEEFKDRIVFGYRHFPLDKHLFAQKAAEAAEAAGAQGKFWEMYNVLFDNQDKFSADYFAGLGKELGINEEQYSNALSARTYRQKVEADLADGVRFGVNETPTFFLNGKKLILTSFADLQVEVKKAL